MQVTDDSTQERVNTSDESGDELSEARESKARTTSKLGEHGVGGEGPDLGAALVSARDEPLTVGREADNGDGRVVRLVCLQYALALQIPQLQLSVLASGGTATAIRLISTRALREGNVDSTYKNCACGWKATEVTDVVCAEKVRASLRWIRSQIFTLPSAKPTARSSSRASKLMQRGEAPTSVKLCIAD